MLHLNTAGRLDLDPTQLPDKVAQWPGVLKVRMPGTLQMNIQGRLGVGAQNTPGFFKVNTPGTLSIETEGVLRWMRAVETGDRFLQFIPRIGPTY